MAKKILVIGHDSGLREVLADILQAEGFEPIAAECVERAEELARDQRTSAVLADLEGPIHDRALENPLRRIAQAAPNVPIILCTTTPRSVNRENLPCSVAAILTMPFEIDQLIETLNQVIEQAEGREFLADSDPLPPDCETCPPR